MFCGRVAGCRCLCIWVVRPANERQSFPHISQLMWGFVDLVLILVYPLRTDRKWTQLFSKVSIPIWIILRFCHFSYWSTDMLNCLRQSFYWVLKSFLWFWCFSLPFTHFTVKQLFWQASVIHSNNMIRPTKTTLHYHDSMLVSPSHSNTSVSRIWDWHPIESICRKHRR